MKENIYDRETFFAKYSRFPRSVQGLTAAGEWHELQRLMPDCAGRRVLDLGCGFGWHCLYAAGQGASRVLGVDISAKMLAVAREKACSAKIEYRRAAMEDLEFEPESFDLVLSSLALHYVESFGRLAEKVYAWLAKGGTFLFSVEHPVFTAYGSQEWYHDALGNRLHWPVDRYFCEGRRKAVFLGEEVEKQHKTLTTYVDSLLKAGFAIKALVEPKPEPRLLETVPEMADELRRPMMLILSGGK